MDIALLESRYTPSATDTAKGLSTPAKPLPSATLGRSHPTYTSQANRNLPRARVQALGKDYDESQTIQLGKIK